MTEERAKRRTIPAHNQQDPIMDVISSCKLGIAELGSVRTCAKRAGLTPAIVRRFLSKVKPSATGCWKWTGSHYTPRTHSSGSPKLAYGCFQLGVRRQALAHRLMWQLYCGPVASGILICHRCDNPGCVRPDHLFRGTNADNHRDSALKCRRNQKLSAADVLDIRRLRADGWCLKPLAERFGVSQTCVSLVARGLRRQHVHADFNAGRRQTEQGRVA